MEDEKEDGFRKLILTAGPDQPGADFTQAIMKRVQAASEQDSAKEAALIRLLQAHTLVEKPSADFSRRAMNRIIVSPPKPLAPIIRPGVWYMMAASLLLIVLFCTLLPFAPSQPTSSEPDRFFRDLEASLDALPINYVLTIFVVSVLMMVDFLLRRTRPMPY
ncbi:hypothetical protein [Spirosoma koreense]